MSNLLEYQVNYAVKIKETFDVLAFIYKQLKFKTAEQY